MKGINTLAVTLCALTATAGCGMTNQQVGAVAGGAVGAGAGYGLSRAIGVGRSGQVVGAIAGTAAGALVGYQIGKMLDERDRPQHAAATQNALETGSPQVWKNPETGNSGKVEVKETAAAPVGSGRSGATPSASQVPGPAAGASATKAAGTAAVGQCKTLKQTITLKDGTTREEEVKACKGANGWETVS